MDQIGDLPRIVTIWVRGTEAIEIAARFVVDHGWVPLIVAVLLILWGVIAWRRLRSGVKPILRSVGAFDARLAKIPDPEAFVTEYETLNQIFAQDKILGHTWQEFTETLIPPHVPDERIKNTSRPNIYFNDDILTRVGINTSLYEALPNYLVGAGLFFTFVGLLLALYFAGQGVSAQSVEVAQKALKDLLGAATFKFMTSIAGLGTSIWFSWQKKGLLHQVDVAFDNLCSNLEARLDFVTPVALAFAQHRELQIHSRELQKFNDDIAFSIAEALDKKLSDNLSRVMAPLAESVEKMAGRFGEMNQDALERMISSFTEKLEGAAGQQIEALVEGLREVEGTVSPLGKQFLDFGETLRDLDQQLGEHREGLAQLTNDFNETLRRLREAIEQLSGTATPIHQTAMSLEASLEKVSQLTESFDRLQWRVGQLNDAMRGAAEELGKSWESYRSRFESLDQSLEAVFGELNTGLDTYRGQIETFVQKVDSDMSRAVGMLSSAIQELNTTTEELTLAFGDRGSSQTSSDQQMGEPARFEG